MRCSCLNILVEVSSFGRRRPHGGRRIGRVCRSLRPALPAERAQHVISPAQRLLEPGALLQGALFRDLLGSREIALEPGKRLGVFRLIREIGRGGMGVVWLAERDDGEYSQQVAIKCIVDRGSERGVELFRRERQILAELGHPNIARLLDGGRGDDGLLWFAMELVEGVAIDRHAREGGLSLDARLRLFMAVIDAVSVAHARLVIHRDIKPGNVLVDADGRAKLLDFGIAALADDDAAARAYSPGWASPEQQAGGSVGTASDQYQLGLLFDAMLRRDESSTAPRAAGMRHDPASWIEMPQYRQQELRAVLARACATATEARYQSVAELGRELERMLEKRPVSAMGRRFAYPLACAMRRRPGVFVATTAAVLLIVVLVSAFTWRLARERDTSRIEAARAEAIKDFLVGLFRDGDPTRGSDPDLSARALIQAGVLRVEVDRSLPADARWELMQLLADIQLRLGDGEHAAALLERIDRSKLEPGDYAELEGRLDALRGRPNDALRHLTDALVHENTPERQLLLARAESDAGQSAEAAKRLEALLRDAPQLPDALAASAWVGLGVLRWRDGRPKDALLAYDRALERAKRASESVSPVALRINKGLALIDLGRFDEALAEYEKAESELTRFPNFKHQGLILQNRGMALYRRGDVDDAQDVWTILLGLVDDGVNPGVEASTVHNLASTADSVGDPVASIDYSLRAQALREQLGDAPSALSSRINVIAKLYSFGHAEAGVRMAAEAMARAQKMQRPDLEARARLGGATSGCVLERQGCVASLEASAAQFAKQGNQVKLLETLEKLALVAFEQRDQATLERTIAAFSAAIGASSDAGLSSRIGLLRVLVTRDPLAIAARAKDEWRARYALVLLAIGRGDVGAAQRELALLTTEQSDRYWLLHERVALLARDAPNAARARAERAKLREQVQALLRRA